MPLAVSTNESPFYPYIVRSAVRPHSGRWITLALLGDALTEATVRCKVRRVGDSMLRKVGQVDVGPHANCLVSDDGDVCEGAIE